MVLEFLQHHLDWPPLKEVQIQDEFRGVIPAGKIKEFDQAFAAFIQTLNIILK